MALKFTATNWNSYDSVRVGLDPSEGTGLVEILSDPDKNGVFKITDKDTQKFVVEARRGATIIRKEWDLSGLTLADPVPPIPDVNPFSAGNLALARHTDYEGAPAGTWQQNGLNPTFTKVSDGVYTVAFSASGYCAASVPYYLGIDLNSELFEATDTINVTYTTKNTSDVTVDTGTLTTTGDGKFAIKITNTTVTKIELSIEIVDKYTITVSGNRNFELRNIF